MEEFNQFFDDDVNRERRSIMSMGIFKGFFFSLSQRRIQRPILSFYSFINLIYLFSDTENTVHSTFDPISYWWCIAFATVPPIDSISTLTLHDKLSNLLIVFYELYFYIGSSTWWLFPCERKRENLLKKFLRLTSQIKFHFIRFCFGILSVKK